MTDYDDLSRVNELYDLSQRLAIAINNIDTGGTVSNMTIVPAIATPGFIAPEEIDAVAMIELIGVTPQLLIETRAVLVTMQTSVLNELQSLGVTMPP